MRLGISPPPGLILTIHGLPPQFLLAVAYLETLLTEKFGCGMKSCGARRGGLDHTPQAGGDVPSFAEDEDLPPSLWSVDNIEITAPVLIQVDFAGPRMCVCLHTFRNYIYFISFVLYSVTLLCAKVSFLPNSVSRVVL